MAYKFLVALAVIGICAAYPADEVPPQSPATLNQPLPPSDSSIPPQDAPAAVPVGALPLTPELDQRAPASEAESDLNTDSTYWWRKSYYPSYRSYGSYYPRHYSSYYPRSYSGYSYYNPYSYWSSWW